MFTSAFWVYAGERAIKSLAQGFLAVLTLGSSGLDLFTVNWKGALGVGLGTAVYSVATSLAGIQVGASKNDPFLVDHGKHEGA